MMRQMERGVSKAVKNEGVEPIEIDLVHAAKGSQRLPVDCVREYEAAALEHHPPYPIMSNGERLKGFLTLERL